MPLLLFLFLPLPQQLRNCDIYNHIKHKQLVIGTCMIVYQNQMYACINNYNQMRLIMWTIVHRGT